MNALLRDPRTRYVVVTSPESEPIREAQFIIDELASERVGVHAIICNQMTPRRGDVSESEITAAPRHAAIHQTLVRKRHDEEQRLDELRSTLTPGTIVAVVDLLGRDVSSLDALDDLSASL